jgi:ribonuclease HII
VPSLPVIGGDAAAACIAAASVLAKVSRDRLMVAMETDHPGYGFAVHKGYSTAAHSAALNELGPCSEHRQSFINVRRVASGSGTRVRWETMQAAGTPEVGVGPSRGAARGRARQLVQAECNPASPIDVPDRHGRNEWGKMRALNQTRDGEGRLSR